MATGLLNLERVAASMRHAVTAYAEHVGTLSGSNGLALTLFDSIAAGTFDPKRHVARSILILQTMDLHLLRSLAKEGQKWGKANLAAPLIMTPDYIASSVDTFPLEFLEIHQQHLTIFGQEYFDTIDLNGDHVRLQCERELKAILIGMRQGLLAAAGRERLFAPMEADVTDRLMRTLRGLLWLHGRTAATPRDDVLNLIETHLDTPLLGIRTAINEAVPHGWEEFCSLYADVDRLKDVVNEW